MKRSNHKWKIIYHYFSRISILQLKMKQDIFPSKLLYYQNYHDQETKQDLQSTLNRMKMEIYTNENKT